MQAIAKRDGVMIHDLIKKLAEDVSVALHSLHNLVAFAKCQPQSRAHCR